MCLSAFILGHSAFGALPAAASKGDGFGLSMYSFREVYKCGVWEASGKTRVRFIHHLERKNLIYPTVSPGGNVPVSEENRKNSDGSDFSFIC